MADDGAVGDEAGVAPVELVGVAIAAALLCWSALFAPPGGITSAMQSTAAVFGFAIVLWLTDAVPYVVSGALSVVFLFALGAVDSFEAAASGFASTLVFFLLLLFLLGQAIGKVGLDARFAARLLSGDERSPRLVRSLAMHLLALAFVMPSAVARTVTFIPIVRRLSEAYGLERDSDFRRSAFLIIGHANPIASMALMTGGGMAIVTSELIRTEVRALTWVEWATLMVPPVVALYVLCALTAERFYGDADLIERETNGTERGPSEATRTASDDGDEAGGTLTRDQRIVAAVMVGAIVLWVGGSFVGLPTIVPAGLAVAALASPGVGIITAEDVSGVSWEIIFVIGTMFSVLDAAQSTGLLPYVMGAVTEAIPFAALARWQLVAVLLAFAAVVRVFFSTASAAIVVVLPIVVRFGGAFGLNPLYLALSVLLVVGSTTVFPFNTTTVLLSFDRGPLSNADVFAFGMMTMAYSALVVAVAWFLYWPYVS